MNIKNPVIQSFDNSAKNYEQSAKIQKEIGLRLIERLDYLKIEPRYVLDLGCGTGCFSEMLAKRFKDACIIGLDLSIEMLHIAKGKTRFWRKWPLIHADMMHLPFETGLFDLIFSNQVLHWAPALPPLLSELNRVMNKDGCLLFSTLGPDTFKEMRAAFAKKDNYQHANVFVDMHHIGDQLLAQGFLDPVVDMESITLRYNSIRDLVLSLKAQGVKNIHAQRNKGLTGKTIWQNLEEGWQVADSSEKKFPLSYEVVYGIAFKGQQFKNNERNETRIPLSEIKRKPRS